MSGERLSKERPPGSFRVVPLSGSQPPIPRPALPGWTPLYPCRAVNPHTLLSSPGRRCRLDSFLLPSEERGGEGKQKQKAGCPAPEEKDLRVYVSLFFFFFFGFLIAQFKKNSDWGIGFRSGTPPGGRTRSAGGAGMAVTRMMKSRCRHGGGLCLETAPTRAVRWE